MLCCCCERRSWRDGLSPGTPRALQGASLAAEVSIGPGASGPVSGTRWWTKSSGRAAVKGPCWGLVRQRRASGWEMPAHQLLRLRLGLTPVLPRLLLYMVVPARSEPQELLLFFQPCSCLTVVLGPPQHTLQWQPPVQEHWKLLVGFLRDEEIPMSPSVPSRELLEGQRKEKEKRTTWAPRFPSLCQQSGNSQYKPVSTCPQLAFCRLLSGPNIYTFAVLQIFPLNYTC